MNIVVFGAAGWVGRAVLENLRAHHHVRAVDHSETAWESLGDIDGDWQGDETVHCDIVDYAAVDGAMEGMDAVIHTTVLGGGSYGTDDEAPFLVNLKGLWNVLNAARQRGIGRVVHVGSCQVEHPHGVFFDAHVRRPDGSLYAVTKRLQEEMCRQFHDAFGLAVVVLRPCSIVDSRLGIGKNRMPLAGGWNTGWVCRHDLAEACRLATQVEGIEFEVLHAAGTREADALCNVARTRLVLNMEFRGDLDQYR
ncbi:MAG: NAD(P)-dependent oxidoreductase [Candidatus Latescibacterota bacterium]|jgi:nucleoside-diphosphate-sugar epimerase|nr:NAD(P)-dependent oxidoreductase [Candidatus Latescibacterota bacterium]